MPGRRDCRAGLRVRRMVWPGLAGTSSRTPCRTSVSLSDVSFRNARTQGRVGLFAGWEAAFGGLLGVHGLVGALEEVGEAAVLAGRALGHADADRQGVLGMFR